MTQTPYWYRGFGRAFAFILPIILFGLAWPSPAEAQQRHRRRPPIPQAALTPGLWQKSVAGGYVGPWLAGNFGKDVDLTGGRFKGNETSFLLEFFFRPHLLGVISADLSLGAINRGDIRITQFPNTDSTSSFFGGVTLYPIGFGLRIAPFASQTHWKVQPILTGGGSLLILTQRGQLQSISGNRQFIRLDIDTHAEIGYYAGAGLNVILSNKFMLTGLAKYQRAEFDKDLLAGGNYSGMQILFGAAYLYR